MTKYIYIHGLFSSRESFKYKILQKEYPNIDILEWDIKSNIKEQLDNITKTIKIDDKLIIIGDSTGGNFACQLKDKLNKLNISTGLVLLNPLLDIESIFDKSIIPDVSLEYIKKILDIKNSLIILSDNDEVVDNSNISKFGDKNTIINIDDTHRLYKFSDCIEHIEKYSKTI